MLSLSNESHKIAKEINIAREKLVKEDNILDFFFSFFLLLPK